ncbi:DDB1- and CUL4-associated factor 4-like [Argonauta hians]
MSHPRARKTEKWERSKKETPYSAAKSESYNSCSSSSSQSFSPSPSTSRSAYNSNSKNMHNTSGTHLHKYSKKLKNGPGAGPSLPDIEMSCMYLSKEGKRKFPRNRKHWKSYFKNRPQQNLTQNNHTDAVPTSSDSTPKSEEEKQLELAGYYFDKEQKKYFKILPDNNHPIENVYTKMRIIAKEREEKRQKDVQAMKEKLCQMSKALYSKNNITIWLEHMKTGSIDHKQMSSFYLKKNIASLRPFWQKVFLGFDPYEPLNHCLQMLVSPSCDEIVGTWSVQSIQSVHKQHLQLLHIKRQTPTRGNNAIPIEIDNFGTSIRHSQGVVSSSCWAPLSDNSDARWVLYTTCSQLGLPANSALIRNFKPQDGENFYVADFNLGKTLSWACAWNQNTHQFGVGVEKKAYLVDVESKKKWGVNSCNSDVLSQEFAQQSKSLLINGTRRGDILVHDLRISYSKHATVMEQSHPVCSLKSLQNGYQLIAADFKGQIKLWDSRQQRVLMDYTGHSNSHNHLPVNIDSSEQILYAVGADRYSRFWDLKTGMLLREIPPPYEFSSRHIPVIHYSDHWAGFYGNSAMLMAIKDEFHLYACDLSA